MAWYSFDGCVTNSAERDIYILVEYVGNSSNYIRVGCRSGSVYPDGAHVVCADTPPYESWSDGWEQTWQDLTWYEAGGNGGGGGAYSIETSYAVTPGNSYSYTVGTGGATDGASGGDSYWVNTSSVLAKGGTNVTGGAAASGAGDTKYSGGNGATIAAGTINGGGGGSSAGTGANGNNGSGATAGAAPTGGGAGGNGGATGCADGTAAAAVGGGGGGAAAGEGTFGAGYAGQIRITYTQGGTTTTISTSGTPSTYGDNVTFTATVTALAGSDTPSGTVTFKEGSTTIGTGTLGGSGGVATATFSTTLLTEGTHANITAVYGGDSNFGGSTSSAISQTVNARSLTITASNISKTYGDTYTFAGTEFTTSGLVNSDTVTSVTLTSAGADAAAPVGDYAIVPAAAAGIGLGNYSITYVNGSLMVRPGIVITASSSGKTYGDTVTFNGTEFTVTGLGESDTLTSVTLTSDGAGAAARTGTWDIVVSAAVGTGLDNYDVTYVNGTLTVNPRALSITASNASKSGGSTAALTGTEFSTSGLVNGDRVTMVTLTCAGAEASAAGGTYDIVPSAAAGQGLDNYTITYVNGTLTVNKTAVVWSVTSSPAMTTEGETVTITATIKPTIAWSVTPPSVSNVPEGEDPITYGIQLTPSGAIGTVTFNYFGVMMTANITYTKATGTVTFRDGGTVLGTARLVNGTATLTVTDLPAGSHYITASYDGDDNFEGGTTLAHVHSVQPGPGPNWWLIGGTTGGAVLLVLFLLLLFLLLRRRRRRRLAAQG